MRLVPIAFVTSISVAVAQVALAAPATVSVFEAAVREAPSPSSAVIATLDEGTAVTVSEEVQNGWRRVRLPDGRKGWIQDAHVRLEANPKVDSVVRQPVAAPPRSNSIVYVKDLEHLAWLVRSDRLVAVKAQMLSDSHTQAMWAGYGGVALGSALAITGIAVGDCHSDGPCVHWDNILALAGGTVMLSGLIAMLVIDPDRDDLLDVLNLWNVRHPDEPFQFGDALAK